MRNLIDLYVQNTSTPGSDYELSDYTVRQYGYVLQLFNRHIGKDIDIGSISPEQVNGFFQHLTGKRYSQSSMVQARSCIRSFLSFLYMEGFIEKDLSETIRNRRRGRGKRRSKPLPVFLTDDEYSMFRGQLSGRDLLISDMLYCTGLRVQELLHISPHDVDLDSKMLMIHGKGGKMRRVFIVDSLIDEPVIPRLFERLSKIKDNGLVFQVSPRRIQQIFDSTRKKCEIDKEVTPHKLRHSFATRLVGEGVRTEIVQQLLGHESISTTQIYAKVTQQAVFKELTDKELI